MARTTSSAVIAILVTGKNYDGTTDLTAFIETATAMVDSVVECATAKGVTLSSTLLEVIERWLSAHYYAHADQLYKSKQTGRASATFQGETKMGLDSTQYGQTAKSLDPSGCLASLSEGSKRAQLVWLGLAPSSQTDYRDRN